ncbi:MAG TPA: hypothetical protein VNA30_05620 [Mycobacteriales bacterium]|nr:hypothetical protein [Mycobacteriales bacterium]
MSARSRIARPAVAVGLGLAVLTGSAVYAADAPRTTTSSSTFFLRQEGCGTTAEAGRLEPKSGADGATGCGTIGGVPFDEALHMAGEAIADTYDTVGKGLPIGLDVAKKVTGQLAAHSGNNQTGVGTVTFDVTLIGATTTGASVDFGSTTVSAQASPPAKIVLVPFTLNIPATAKGVALKSLSLSVVQRGLNVGFAAKQLDGDSYVVIPTKPLPKAKKKK